MAVTGNPSDGAVILSTLLVTTAFTPIKSAIQDQLDRSFGDAADVERRLDEFVKTVADSLAVPATERVLLAFFRLARTGTGSSGGAVYASGPAGDRLVSQTDVRAPNPTIIVSVGTSGVIRGWLEPDPRAGGRPLHPRDVAAVTAVAERLADAIAPVPDLDEAGERPKGEPRRQARPTRS